jgi:hypothetical protein
MTYYEFSRSSCENIRALASYTLISFQQGFYTWTNWIHLDHRLQLLRSKWQIERQQAISECLLMDPRTTTDDNEIKNGHPTSWATQGNWSEVRIGTGADRGVGAQALKQSARLFIRSLWAAVLGC